MFNIEFDEEELQVLVDMIDTCIADLRAEIHATDNRDYKEMLKKRRQVVEKLKQSLENQKSGT